MFPTKNAITLTARKKLVTLLNQSLADAVDLVTQSKQAHWNVRGDDISSRLQEYPASASSQHAHVEALSSALAAFAARCRAWIDETDALGDKVTADIFTGIARGIDKQLWFVESHLSVEDAIRPRKSRRG
jgi:starvation-inducible DNA-binding protein